MSDETVDARPPSEGARATVWHHESFPVALPAEADAVLEIDRAVLTPYRSGRLRTLQAPRRWTQGAVYDALGNLVEASQRVGGLGGDDVVASDPAIVRRPARRWIPWPVTKRTPQRLAGTWLYAGTWMYRFGHFITETLTNLWPDGLDVIGIVAHPFVAKGTETDWQRDLIDLSGYGSLPIIVPRHALRVERLFVPTRPYVPNGYATPMALRAWQRVAVAANPIEPLPTRTKPLFISRTRWHRRMEALGREAKRGLPNEQSLDHLMERRGYDVIHPEEMQIRAQIAAVRSAEILIGVSGSGLHLSAFARPGTRVVEICDRRSGTVRLPNQRVVDAACGHLTAVVPFVDKGPAFDFDGLEAWFDQAEI